MTDLLESIDPQTLIKLISTLDKIPELVESALENLQYSQSETESMNLRMAYLNLGGSFITQDLSTGKFNYDRKSHQNAFNLMISDLQAMGVEPQGQEGAESE